MSQTGSSQEPIEESLHNQPQPDPLLAELMRRVAKAQEAHKGREEEEPPPQRGDEQSAREESKPVPSPRPSRVRFNRD